MLAFEKARVVKPPPKGTGKRVVLFGFDLPVEWRLA